MRVPRFRYIVRDSRGKERSGHLDAADLDEAWSEMGKRAHKVVRIWPLGETPERPRKEVSEASTRVVPLRKPNREVPQAEPEDLGPKGLKGEDLELFTLHLATMLSVGMGLTPALDVLSNSENEELGLCSELLVRDLESGYTLSAAMRHQSRTFPMSFVRVVETGEVTGKMADCLFRLYRTLERGNKTKRRLQGALTYPAFLLTTCAALVFLILYYIFPMVISVTKTSGVQPPALTRFFIYLTRGSTLMNLAVFGLLGLAILVVVARNPKTGTRLRRFFEERTPFGRFFVLTMVLASCRHLALMIGSGVDLLRSLVHSGNIGERSILVREAFDDVIHRVKLGSELSQSMELHSVFPKALPGMVAVSEESGSLEPLLTRFCDVLEDDINTKISVATAALEPMILMFMGILIGTVLIAAFLPIYELVRL